ncbi:hypothetical protein FA13DRAFT_1786320 [Coprinellus micaceus]|uniref:Uncharacterized protein n=1 Tax=Coprinellus micaceus TaxID=71717 RepID=A0A4Y7TU83_COPMI|nr:hypothetical protein FA13DRAFT_1786320 [Coprinellus micaceus]
MDRDTQDILGQPTLPAMEGFHHSPSSFSPLSAILILIVLGGLWGAGVSLHRMYQENREKSLKLATRRRLGIPDSDRRPFNVAYAAAMLAKEEREKNERSKPRRQLPERPQAPHQPPPHPELRNRSDRYRSATSMPFPGAYTSSSYSSFGSPSHQHQVPQEQQQQHTNGQPGTSRHAARRIVDLSSEVEPRKRGYDDSDLDLLSDPETTRKSRRLDDDADDDDDELMDEDDDGNGDVSYDVAGEAEWEDYETALSHQRPMKRGLLGDAGEQGRDKRARKVSLVPEDMEVDVEEEERQDELHDLRSPVRGKKRDRAEAGSTFGGDDDDGSGAEDEKARRSRRKRRSLWKRKSDIGIGSRKRDREMDIDDDLDSSPDAASQRKHKKGKAPFEG